MNRSIFDELEEAPTYRKIVHFVKTNLRDEKVSGLDHTIRVLYWCRLIGPSEGADIEILEIAALLHDVTVPTAGRPKHFDEGAKMAERLLKNPGFSKDKIDRITHAIRAHSRFGGPRPETLEDKVLYDADVLDYIGVIGSMRAIVRGFVEGVFSGDIFTAPDLLDKVSKSIGQRFYTKKGLEIGMDRQKYLERLVNDLKVELEFEK